MSSIRGLVISPPIVINGTSMLIKTTELNPQQLRANLLFWDKLDFPRNHLIHIGENQDVSFLLKAGILTRTPANIREIGDVAPLYLRAHLEVFRSLDHQEPGVWSLATGDDAISFPVELVTPGGGAEVSLVNAIPVPDIEVPFDDILRFKEKRNSELLALRNELESINRLVINSEESSRNIELAIERVSRAAVNNIQVSKEFPIKWRWSNLTAKLNLVGGAVGGAVGEFMGQKIGWPGLGGAVAGAVFQGIKIDIGGSLVWTKPAATPYQYVSAFHNEVFGGR